MDAQQSAERRRRALSALMDGEDAAAGEFPASTAAAAGESVCRWVCESWRGDGELREDWHAYHLIGDVLRAGAAAHVQAAPDFVARVQARLQAEGVATAPAAEAISQRPDSARRRKSSGAGLPGMARARMPRWPA